MYYTQVFSACRERAARGQIFLLAACRGPHDGHQILLIARLISRDAFGLGRHWHTPAGTGARTAFPPPGDSSVVAPAALCLAGGAAKPTRRRRARRDPCPAAGRVEVRLYPRPPSAPAGRRHARGWWWLAPTGGFQKPKDMLGQCGTMSDARGSSSGRRRRPLSNVSATGTTSAPGACLRSRLRRGDAPTLPPNLPRYIVAKATGLGRSVANGRRKQFETRLFRSGSVVRFGVLRPGPSAHVGEGKPPPCRDPAGWAYGLLLVAGFCTWGGMLLLLCGLFCLPSRAPCWLGSAAGGSRRL